MQNTNIAPSTSDASSYFWDNQQDQRQQQAESFPAYNIPTSAEFQQGVQQQKHQPVQHETIEGYHHQTSSSSSGQPNISMPTTYAQQAQYQQQPSFLYVTGQQQQQLAPGSQQDLWVGQEESFNSQYSADSQGSSSMRREKPIKKKGPYTHDPYGQSMRRSSGPSSNASNNGEYHNNESFTNSGGSVINSPDDHLALPATTGQVVFYPVSASVPPQTTTTQGSSFVGQHSRGSSGGSSSSESLNVAKRTKSKGRGGTRRSPSVKIPEVVTEETVTSILPSSLVAAICLPAGSSFFQSALKQLPELTLSVLSEVVIANLAQLFVDKQACYVVKAVLERLSKDFYLPALLDALHNESFIVMLFTKDLHSRRMLQFILDACFQETSQRFLEVAISRVLTLANDANGCISLQRMLDRFSQPEKEVFFAMAARPNFSQFIVADQAHFILNYMLQEGDIGFNTQIVQETLCSSQTGMGGEALLRLVLHRNASSVIEKALSHIHIEVKNDIIATLFSDLITEPQLLQLLSDANANYVVQSAIRYSSLEVLYFIQARCYRLLPMMSSTLSERLTSTVEQAIAARLQQQQL